MPKNPTRSSQGGDVEGTESTDNQWGVGSPTSVARASFNGGYSLDNSWGAEVGSDADLSNADLKQGYTSYGKRKVGQ